MPERVKRIPRAVLPRHGYLSEGFFSLALGCMACLGDWPTVKAKVPRTCWG